MKTTRSLVLLGVLCATPLLPVQPCSAAEPGTALVFTKASGYEHGIVRRQKDKLSFAEERLQQMLRQRGFEVEATKDGAVFDGDLGRFALFVFFTHGNLLEAGKDGNPPMSAEGKGKLLAAIEGGTPFVGLHSASTTFHRVKEQMAEPLDPFLMMVGGEFRAHTFTQEGSVAITQPALPGLDSAASPEVVREEFTMFQSLDPGMQVLATMDPRTMDEKKGSAYRKQSLHPVAWVRMHGKGRVFYNSLGQEQPLWDAPIFLALMKAGLDWATGQSAHTPVSNLQTVIPDAPMLPTTNR